MEAVVQWATILSPIIAILIAVWAIRSSAKDTAKQIVALEESTTRQIESVKQLAKIQLEISQIQINKELWEARSRFLQADKKQGEMAKFEHSFTMAADIANMYREQHARNVDLSSESEFQQKYARALEQYQSRLSQLSKEMGGV